MSEAPADVVAAAAAIVCRVGACAALTPGLSSPRLPVRIRLAAALALSIGVGATVWREALEAVARPGAAGLAALILVEIATGAAIGFFARVVFVAVEFAAVAASFAIGLSASFAPPVGDDQGLPVLASLMTLTATLAFLAADLHHETIAALARSYAAVPVGFGPEARPLLARALDATAGAFVAGLRIAAPFLLFSIAVNLAFGLLGKAAPSTQTYFLSAPAAMLGGLALLAATDGAFVHTFVAAVSATLTRL